MLTSHRYFLIMRNLKKLSKLRVSKNVFLSILSIIGTFFKNEHPKDFLNLIEKTLKQFLEEVWRVFFRKIVRKI